MKQSLIAIALLIVAGCSTGNDAATDQNRFRTQCIDGVVYYVFGEQAGYAGWGYMSVKFNQDSTVTTCQSYVPRGVQ